jgi:SSS family solute:Na+ symporter
MQLQFGPWDIAVFVAFVATVLFVGISKSRHEKTGEDYFLAGRGLVWWLIGFSLIAANISTEQFVGMSGNAASHVGLAIASYEWMAAITLVVIAFAFLPYFLRAGIYTMPEFLEYRFNSAARTLMAAMTILVYILLVGAVTYSGALTMRTLAGKMGYNVPLLTGSLAIGLIAMIYVVAGGLKACAWADLIQGSALIIGGGVIMWFAFDKLGSAAEAAKIVDVNTGAVSIEALKQGTPAIERFWDLNRVRMNMYLPSTDSVLPWTALLLGLWIPNFYYWGLNQYITQRTLGSVSLSQGQKGIVFAAFLKLLIPLVIVIPGIISFNLFFGDMQLEAARDNAPLIAKYLKANPDTKFVEVVQSPTEQQIADWPKGKFMLAIFESDSYLKQIKVGNPRVLPLSRDAFDKTTVGEYTAFKTDDKSFPSTFPAFYEEIQAYDGKTEEAATAAGKSVTVEKLTAYKYDTALGQLLGSVLPQRVGLVGFVLAALLGAVVSSLAAMLNAASTIFTMDIYKKYISPQASGGALVFLGRVTVVIFAVFAVILAPQLGNPKINNSIFTIIQGVQGLLSPGVLAVFAFGLAVRRAPRICGIVGLLTNIVLYITFWLISMSKSLMNYEILNFLFNNFLNRMALSFIICLIVLSIITIVKPLAQPMQFEHKTSIDVKSSKGAALAGVFVIVLTLLLYLLFSPFILAK